MKLEKLTQRIFLPVVVIGIICILTGVECLGTKWETVNGTILRVNGHTDQSGTRVETVLISLQTGEQLYLSIPSSFAREGECVVCQKGHTRILHRVIYHFNLKAESPGAAIIRLEKEWGKGNGSFTWEFWKFSGAIGKEHGTNLIAPIMERSKKWKGEEGLIYVPLLALLPREETIKIFRDYENGSDEESKLWVHEFLGEFEMSDTKATVNKYQAEQSSPSRAYRT